MVRLATPAAVSTEPITLVEAKKHLEIATADTTHDTHVTMLITAAREQWEHDTQSLVVSRAVTEQLESFPESTWRLFYRPATAITSVKYYDSLNAQQTLASSEYTLTPDGRLLLAVDKDWPDYTERWDSIEVIYVAGATPTIAKQAMLLQLDVMFELRGQTKEKDACIRAYESLVARYQRSSYP